MEWEVEGAFDLGGASGVGASKCECSEPVSKAYMTTTDYTFLGTLITENSFASVTQNKLPKAQARGVSEQETKREATVLQKLETATKGPSNTNSRRIAWPTPSPCGLISAHLVADCKQTGGGYRVSWLLR